MVWFEKASVTETRIFFFLSLCGMFSVSVVVEIDLVRSGTNLLNLMVHVVLVQISGKNGSKIS